MARTKASVGAKVSSVKSSKVRSISAAPTTTYGSSGSGGSDRASSRGSGGGNPVCPRETPKWQKPITNFLIGNKQLEEQHGTTSHMEEDEEVGPSTIKKKRRPIIESDDEADTETPRNCELEESFILDPLEGEKNHKINEYYNENKMEQDMEQDGMNDDEINVKGMNINENKENVNEMEFDNNNKRPAKRSMNESSDEIMSKRIRTN